MSSEVNTSDFWGMMEVSLFLGNYDSLLGTITLQIGQIQKKFISEKDILFAYLYVALHEFCHAMGMEDEAICIATSRKMVEQLMGVKVG